MTETDEMTATRRLAEEQLAAAQQQQAAATAAVTPVPTAEQAEEAKAPPAPAPTPPADPVPDPPASPDPPAAPAATVADVTVYVVQQRRELLADEGVTDEMLCVVAWVDIATVKLPKKTKRASAIKAALEKAKIPEVQAGLLRVLDDESAEAWGQVEQPAPLAWERGVDPAAVDQPEPETAG